MTFNLTPTEHTALRDTGEARVVREMEQPRVDSEGIHFEWASFYTNGNVFTWDEDGVGEQNWNANDFPDEDKFVEALKRTPYKKPSPFPPAGTREVIDGIPCVWGEGGCTQKKPSLCMPNEIDTWYWVGHIRKDTE